MQVKAWFYIENNTSDEQEQQKEISRAETIGTASQIWHESNSRTSIAKQSHGDVKTPTHEGWNHKRNVSLSEMCFHLIFKSW